MQDHKMVQKGNNIGNNSRSSYDKKLLKKRYKNIARDTMKKTNELITRSKTRKITTYCDGKPMYC